MGELFHTLLDADITGGDVIALLVLILLVGALVLVVLVLVRSRAKLSAGPFSLNAAGAGGEQIDGSNVAAVLGARVVELERRLATVEEELRIERTARERMRAELMEERARLSDRVRDLEQQLAATEAELTETRAELADTRTQLAAAEAEISVLRTLTTGKDHP